MSLRDRVPPVVWLEDHNKAVLNARLQGREDSREAAKEARQSELEAWRILGLVLLAAGPVKVPDELFKMYPRAADVVVHRNNDSTRLLVTFAAEPTP